jgi:hypothetical protein
MKPETNLLSLRLYGDNYSKKGDHEIIFMYNNHSKMIEFLLTNTKPDEIGVETTVVDQGELRIEELEEFSILLNKFVKRIK